LGVRWYWRYCARRGVAGGNELSEEEEKRNREKVEETRDREDKKSLESFDANAQLAMHKSPSDKMRKMEENEKRRTRQEEGGGWLDVVWCGGVGWKLRVAEK
jgi:hypothetical protein